MKYIRKLYGKVTIKLDDFINKYDEFKVEYYKIENYLAEPNSKKYGIEVLKIVEFENNQIIERKEIDNIFDNEEKIDKLLELLKRNKVTPISVEEIIADIICYNSQPIL